MFLKKSEHRRTHPYVAATLGTLAMIGAFNVVRCGKRTVKCVMGKMKSMLGMNKSDCTFDE